VEKPSFLRKNATKLVASAVITVSLVYGLSKGGLKFVPEGGSFSQVRWWIVPVYLALLIGMNYFRAVRWRFLLRSFADVPRMRVLAVSWIGFAAIQILPFRIGELVRPYMIRQRGREENGKIVGRVSLTAATGTIVAERVVDGLFLSIVLAIALITVPHVEPLPPTVVGLKVPVAAVRSAGFALVGVFGAAFATIAVFYFARDLARRLTLAVFGLVSKKLGEKLAGMAENLADGLHFLGRPRDAFPFLLETSLYWFLNAFGMWLLAWGCGVQHADGSGINLAEAAALMGTLGVTILVPGPPGLLGTFQLGIYAGMTMYFPTENVLGPGAAYVFLLYSLQLGWQVLGAGIFLVTNRKNLEQLEEAEGILPAQPADALPPQGAE
jgi:hypothetical protein